MATELAKAYVQIVPSAEGIKGSITNVLGGESESAGRSAGESVGSNLVSTLKKVVVGAGLGAMLKEAFSSGADYEQNLGGIETLFGEGAETMVEKSKIAFKTAGLSANDYMETVMGFSASLKQSVGDDMEALTSISDMAIIDMSDNANKMGSSMESLQNAYSGFAKQNYTMLDNLKLGYGGTKKEMERLLADAEKISGQEYDIENLADVYNAIHVIQTELGITGTTSKEAEETFSGSMASMKASAQNVLSALATGGDVTGALDDMLSSAMVFFERNFVPMLSRILKGIPDIINSLVSGIVNSLYRWEQNAPEIVNYGVDLVKNLAESIITNIPYLVASIGEFAIEIGKALMEFDWLGTAQEFIQNLSDNFSLASREMLGRDGGFIGNLLNMFTESYPAFLEKGWEIITNLLDGILTALPGVVDSAITLMQNFIQGLSDFLPKLVESGTKIISNLLTTILNHLPDIIQSGIKLIGALAEGLLKAGYLVLKAIVKLIANIVDNFKTYDWKALGKNIIDGLVNGLKEAGSKIWETLKSICSDAFQNVKDFFKIGSPSKLMEKEVGRWIPEGIAQGIDKNTAPLTESMEDLANGTVSTINGQLLSNLNTSTSNMTTAKAPNGSNGELLGVLTEYLPIIAEKCGVTLSADAKGIFNVVNEQNRINTRATGLNVLANA